MFDHICRAHREQYRVPFTVELRDGNSGTGCTTVIGGYPDAWFRGGYVERDSGQEDIEQRGIQQHTGNRLVLVGGTSLLALVLGLHAFPGCDQLIQTCNDKLFNTANCGCSAIPSGQAAVRRRSLVATGRSHPCGCKSRFWSRRI
ncbi:phage BR0599 family protein [Pseudomonas aeruginosa]|uniref:phage BR0599 family protein n=1 Tax=Pseudomonas aeruginosa TaxID=287 RepID=UPI0023AEBA30|nr:phage BR0599 family protein [Pseudomonas aeruginosa]MDE8660775.1 phage BR0599 family protein [Pseudomonas aeruginosa]